MPQWRHLALPSFLCCAAPPQLRCPAPAYARPSARDASTTTLQLGHAERMQERAMAAGQDMARSKGMWTVQRTSYGFVRGYLGSQNQTRSRAGIESTLYSFELRERLPAQRKIGWEGCRRKFWLGSFPTRFANTLY